jgi:hypothetical protein
MEIDDDLKRRLNNWARWRVDPARGGIAPCSIYNMALRGPRGEPVAPILAAEADETQQIIEKFKDKRLIRVLEVEYLGAYSYAQMKYSACACSQKEYSRRLEAAHESLIKGLSELKQRQALRYHAMRNSAKAAQ